MRELGQSATPEGAQAVVVGGGPAGLMAAEVLAAGGAAVIVVERMPSVGRKFLMAGRGGLNLTHSEPAERFMARYGALPAPFAAAFAAFPPDAVRAWCEGLGQPVFVGSSGRVFPVAMKASPLLRAWLGRLAGLGVRFVTRRRWVGWRDGALLLDDGTRLEAGAAVLACGGASWPRLGADGGWPAALDGLHVTPLRPANCGFTVAWSDRLRARFAGAPLKRVALRHGEAVARGEATLTEAGIEGGAVYALAPGLREAIAMHGAAVLHVDLRPDLDQAELARRLDTDRGSQSLSTFLRKAGGLSPAAVALVQEALHGGGTAPPGPPPASLAALVKAVPLRLLAPFPLARAISTAGGLAWDELDESMMLRRRPGVFAAGEMLDWEAPTGGYLLQGAFSTGAAAGRGALAWLRARQAV